MNKEKTKKINDLCSRCGGFSIWNDEDKQKEFDRSLKETNLCPQCVKDEYWAREREKH